MNPMPPSIMLLGVGGAGASIVRGVTRAYGSPMRTLILDTDANSGGSGDLPFTLIGASRTAGRGTGGLPANARAAFADAPDLIDHALDGVRTVVVVTGLGGGTGSGATSELLKHLHSLGIVTILFATMPFAFEGADRSQNARTAAGPLSNHADVSVFLPLDDLVAGRSDVMSEALAQAIGTVATGVTLFWRVIEKPGYIRLDSERLRNVLTRSGRAFFASASAHGPDRTRDILAAFANTPLLKELPSHPPKTILMGILAGDDLRLSEISEISSGISAAFAPEATIELGTVNDEDTFSGRLTVVALFFSERSAQSGPFPGSRSRRRFPGAAAKTEHDALAADRSFAKTDSTLWNDENLDIPTYVRRNLTLDR